MGNFEIWKMEMAKEQIYKPDSVPRHYAGTVIIYLGLMLPSGSCDLPEKIRQGVISEV